MKSISLMTLTALLAASSAFADDEAVTGYKTAAPGSLAGADSRASAAEDNPALETQLEAARNKLEAAADEVAELSARIGRPLVQRFMTLGDEPGRAIIGVQLDQAGKDGARVREVSPGGPAAEAGIRSGDVIVAVGGLEVKGEEPVRQVVKALHDVKPESKVTVRVLREGKPRDFTIVARPGFGNNMIFAHGPPPDGLMPGPGPGPDFAFESFLNGGGPFVLHGPIADLELATLTPRLGRYFGTDKGVLVVRTPPDDALKLEEGDVILAIDGREPTSGSHATRILASYQPREKIGLRIMREHKTINVDARLPDRPAAAPGLAIFRGGEPAGRRVTLPGNGTGTP